MSAGAGRGGVEPSDTPSVFEMTLRLTFPGLSAVIKERMRQVEGEGFSEFHDDQHVDGELAQAAAYYAAPGATEHFVRLLFPEAWDAVWMKREGFPVPTDRDLVKAGALIAAELDRRRRASRNYHPHMDRR